MATPTWDDKLEDIGRIVRIVKARNPDKEKLSVGEYRQLGGKYNRGQISGRGHTWGELLTEFDMRPAVSAPVPMTELFERLAAFVSEKGRLPKTTEMDYHGMSTVRTDRDGFFRKAVEGGHIDAKYAPEPALQPMVDESPLQDAPPSVERLEVPSDTPGRIIPPPPRHSLRSNPKWRRIDITGMPYAPQDENAVIALFAILCSQRKIPWQILDITAAKGTDCIRYDEEKGKELMVEFKLKLASSTWNHEHDPVDVVVCWQNSWAKCPMRVIELSKLLP